MNRDLHGILTDRMGMGYSSTDYGQPQPEEVPLDDLLTQAEHDGVAPELIEAMRFLFMKATDSDQDEATRLSQPRRKL